MAAWCGTHDAGPDQKVCKKLALAACNSARSRGGIEFFFTTDCLKHQVQLAIKLQLSLMDKLISSETDMELPCSYFGGVARLMYTWREMNASTKLLEAWTKRFGTLAANQYAAGKAPAPISGRWGAIHDCESLALKAPTNQVREVFAELLATTAATRSKPNRKLPPEPGAIDAIQDIDNKQLSEKLLSLHEDGQLAECMVAHRERKNRWHGDVVKLLEPSNPFFWIMGVMFKTRSPLMHCMNVMNTPDVTPATLDESTPLSTLVYGKAAEIMGEYETLLFASSWVKETSGLQAKDRNLLIMSVVCQVCAMACEYNRRVLVPLSQFPYRLLFLVYAPSWQPCEHRRQVCKDILETLNKGGELEYNCRLLCTHFCSELKHGASTGLFEPFLHLFFRTVRRRWMTDSQKQESDNSIIKHIMKRGPTTSNPTLSHRLQIKKHLQELATCLQQTAYARGEGLTRMRALLKAIPLLAERCVEHSPDSSQITARDRWLPPCGNMCAAAVAAQRLLDVPRHESPAFDGAGWKWIGHFNCKMARAIDKSGFLCCYVIRAGNDRPLSVWVSFTRCRPAWHPSRSNQLFLC